LKSTLKKGDGFASYSALNFGIWVKRSQTHILLAAALAALGACAPLAEVSKTEPKLGAQDGTIAELGVLGAMEHNPELWIMFHCSQNFYMASVLPTSAAFWYHSCALP